MGDKAEDIVHSLDIPKADGEAAAVTQLMKNTIQTCGFVLALTVLQPPVALGHHHPSIQGTPRQCPAREDEEEEDRTFLGVVLPSTNRGAPWLNDRAVEF